MTSKSKTAKTKAQPASKKPAAKVPAKVAKAVAAKKLPSKVIATVNKTVDTMTAVAKEQAAQGNDVTAKIISQTANRMKNAAIKAAIAEKVKNSYPSVDKTAKAVLVKPDAKAKVTPVKPKASKAAAPKVTVKKAKTVSLPPSKTTIVPNKSQYKAVTTKKAPAAPKGTVSTAKTISIAELSQAMRSSQTPANQKPAPTLPVKPPVQVPVQPNIKPVEDRDVKAPYLRTQAASGGKMSAQELFSKMATNAAATVQAAQLPAFLRR